MVMDWHRKEELKSAKVYGIDVNKLKDKNLKDCFTATSRKVFLWGWNGVVVFVDSGLRALGRVAFF